MGEHGEWIKDEQRYEDGCKSDAQPHNAAAGSEPPAGLEDVIAGVLRSSCATNDTHRLAPPIAAAVRDLLASAVETTREDVAKAWDEGYGAAVGDSVARASGWTGSLTPNPHAARLTPTGREEERADSATGLSPACRYDEHAPCHFAIRNEDT